MVASFDWNGPKIVQQISELICSPTKRRMPIETRQSGRRLISSFRQIAIRNLKIFPLQISNRLCGRRIALESLRAFRTSPANVAGFSNSCTLCGARRFVIECPAPSTTIFLAMKNSIIFISALSFVAMMLASCNTVPSAFAPDETATTGVMKQTNEAPRERSAEESVNSMSGGHY